MRSITHCHRGIAMAALSLTAIAISLPAVADDGSLTHLDLYAASNSARVDTLNKTLYGIGGGLRFLAGNINAPFIAGSADYAPVSAQISGVSNEYRFSDYRLGAGWTFGFIPGNTIAVGADYVKLNASNNLSPPVATSPAQANSGFDARLHIQQDIAYNFSVYGEGGYLFLKNQTNGHEITGGVQWMPGRNGAFIEFHYINTNDGSDKLSRESIRVGARLRF